MFITPEKFLYVETAQPLRFMLGKIVVEEIHLVDEDTFGELATYPTLTTLVNSPGPGTTRVRLRDGRIRKVCLSGMANLSLPESD